MTEPIYTPGERLYLWCLREPQKPAWVGTLSLVFTGTRGVSLGYAPDWLRTGFPLSEDLPLLNMEHFPQEKDSAVGAVDDARPDRRGERMIRLIERPPRLSLLEMLYFAGDDRFGALGVSTSAAAYMPHLRGPLAQWRARGRVQHRQRLDAVPSLLVEPPRGGGGSGQGRRGGEWLAGALWRGRGAQAADRPGGRAD